jgi:hypothetical protein
MNYTINSQSARNLHNAVSDNPSRERLLHLLYVGTGTLKGRMTATNGHVLATVTCAADKPDAPNEFISPAAATTSGKAAKKSPTCFIRTAPEKDEFFDAAVGAFVPSGFHEEAIVAERLVGIMNQIWESAQAAVSKESIRVTLSVEELLNLARSICPEKGSLVVDLDIPVKLGEYKAEPIIVRAALGEGFIMPCRGSETPEKKG